MKLFQVGDAFQENESKIKYAYSSPAFRCIQTCDAILRQLHQDGDAIKIRIEPALFELPLWYKGHTLNFMLPEDLLAAGYNVDVTYKPALTLKDVLGNYDENYTGYYKRGSKIMKGIYLLYVLKQIKQFVQQRALLRSLRPNDVQNTEICFYSGNIQIGSKI